MTDGPEPGPADVVALGKIGWNGILSIAALFSAAAWYTTMSRPGSSTVFIEGVNEDDTNKNEEDTNAVSEGAENIEEKTQSTEKTKSLNQLNKDVQTGKAPKGIERFDKGKGSVNLPQDEATFKDGSSLYRDGTWRHNNGHKITNKQKEYLEKNGWKIPQQ